MTFSLQELRARLCQLQAEAKATAWPHYSRLLADIAQVRGAIASVEHALSGLGRWDK